MSKTLLLPLLLACTLSVPATTLATPCTDDCLQGQIDGYVGCGMTYMSQAGSNPYAQTAYNFCMGDAYILGNNCILACLGLPQTGAGPSAITTASTPYNQRCFTQTSTIQLSVNVDPLGDDAVHKVVFFLSVDTLTTPIPLGTDNTPADGFSLTYVPSSLANGLYFISAIPYNQDPEYGMLSGTVFPFYIGDCASTAVPASPSWALTVAGAVMLLTACLSLRRRAAIV